MMEDFSSRKTAAVLSPAKQRRMEVKSRRLEAEKQRIEELKKTRINHNYYTRLETTLAERKEQPTVQDALEVLYEQGNSDYVDGFGLYKKGKQQPFRKTDTAHEIAHLCAHLGHTPFQENMQLAFEIGFDEGANLGDYPSSMLDEFHRIYDGSKEIYKETAKGFQRKKVPDLSKRDTAIYFAAGMYLRNKWEAYCDNAMEIQFDEEKGVAKYEKQKAFCEKYATYDSETLPQQKKLVWGDIEAAPYAFLKLSKDEWRAIEGVALGMYEPEQTVYPQRLGPIKQALVHAGLFFDRPSFVEQVNGEKTKNADIFLKPRER